MSQDWYSSSFVKGCNTLLALLVTKGTGGSEADIGRAQVWICASPLPDEKSKALLAAVQQGV